MLCSEPQVNHDLAHLFPAGLEDLAPLNFDDSLLAGLRSCYRSNAISTAQKTLRAGVLATESILQMAGWIQLMKSRLNRKEFGVFVKGLLQWVGESARKYLDIAKAFEGFDLSRLSQLEPFTLLKLRTKRYAPVVERLREQPVITPNLVFDLIKEVLPKQPRKKATEPISGWKQARSGGARYYNVLLHDEKTGLSIEQQALSEGILPQTVIAEAIAMRAKQKQAELQLHVVDVVVDSEQPDSVREQDQDRTEEVEEDALLPRGELESDRSMEQANEFDQSKQPINNAIASDRIKELAEEVAILKPEVSEYVAEQQSAIAVPPEAVLAGEDRTEIEWLLNAPIHQVEEIIRSVPVRSAYRALYLLNQFQSSDEKRMDLLEQRVTEYHISIGMVEPTEAIASVGSTSEEGEKTQVTGYLERDLESKDKQPAKDDECLEEEDDRNLPKEPQVIRAGVSMQITSGRHGGVQYHA